MQLRSYQTEANDKSYDLLVQGKHPLVVQPTGTGKAVLMAALATRWVESGMGNVLMLAHFKELVDQAAAKYRKYSGRGCQIEMNVNRADVARLALNNQVVVGCVPSLRGKRLRRWPKDVFSLIIVDEAHHSPADSYQSIFDHFEALRWGCTATPFRKDKKRVFRNGTFDCLAYEMQLPQAIHEGWLAPIKQKYIRIEEIRWDQIALNKKRDFTDAEVATVMDRDEVVRPAVEAIFEHAGARPTIVFCATVEHAKHVADVMNDLRPGCASYVASYKILEDGRKVPYPPERREADIDSFKSGRRQFLVNVGVFLEGADLPNCACIAHLVGTKSLGKVMQAVGRGTRTNPADLPNCGATAEERRALIAASVKPDTLVLDFCGVSGQHKLVYTPAMLLPADTPREVAKLFAKKADEAGGIENAEEVLAECHAEVMRRVAKIQEIRNNLKLRVEAVVEDVDPFGDNYVPLTGDKPAARQPTDRQVQALLKLAGKAFTEEQVRRMPQKQVGVLIDKYKAKRDAGPTAYWQVKKLRELRLAVPQKYGDALDLLKRAGVFA